MQTKVIAHEYLPPRLPVFHTALVWLLLDRLQPPGWAWGVTGCLMALWWVGAVYAIHTAEFVHPKDL